MANTLSLGRSDSYLLPPSNQYGRAFNSYGVSLDFEPKCTPPFLVEFHLVAGGVYAGGNLGPDRVVYKYVISASFSSNLSPYTVFT